MPTTTTARVNSIPASAFTSKQEDDLWVYLKVFGPFFVCSPLRLSVWNLTLSGLLPADRHRRSRKEKESSFALQIVLAPVLLRGGAMEEDGNKWILKWTLISFGTNIVSNNFNIAHKISHSLHTDGGQSWGREQEQQKQTQIPGACNDDEEELLLNYCQQKLEEEPPGAIIHEDYGPDEAAAVAEVQ